MNEGLYQKREAFSRTYDFKDSGSAGTGTPGQMAVILLCDICRDFDMPPSVYYKDGEKTVTVLFHDVSFSCLDFCQNYGEIITCLSEDWALTAYGTAENMETCEILCRRDGGKAKAVQKNVSGKAQDLLNDMCLKLECDTPENALVMSDIITFLKPGSEAIAVAKRDEMFCRRQKLPFKSEGSYFCYIRLEEYADYSSFVRSLNIDKKAELWNVFLNYDLCPLEFEWLYRMYQEHLPINLMEWELALRQELETSHYTILHKETYFMVRDAADRERYFDFTSGNQAEKMFLKLLFPIGGHDLK